MHYMLLCGVDYDVNATSDLYFNLIYRGLEFAIHDQMGMIAFPSAKSCSSSAIVGPVLGE